jgi:glycosyltransferase involved in cell wall biosynthesis
MDRALVSILFPFRNTAVFLKECVDSILKQSFPNWELLAVDDHSDDSSCDVLESYARTDKRIRVFKNDGRGIIPALRTAFKNSSGSLITRMDSDDIMHPEKLQVLVSYLLKEGRGHIAIGLVKYFSEEGISDGYERYETWLNNLSRDGNNFSNLYTECVIPSPCFMVHRDDLNHAGAFNEDRYPEDYDLTFRLYRAGFKCIPCDKVIHFWRDYPERTSRNSEHYAANYFLDIKIHYFLKLNWDPEKKLVIWGAGWKGKQIAKELLSRNIPFHWICNNPGKAGHSIYGVTMKEVSYLDSISGSQSIITVANRNSQEEIRSHFALKQGIEMSDYFFFC